MRASKKYFWNVVQMTHWSTKSLPIAFFKTFVKITSTIKKTSPLTKIYVQSVLPFGANNDLSIVAFNHTVNQYCITHKLTFINLYSVVWLKKNGVLNKDYTTDGTHLNAKGYLIWKRRYWTVYK